MASGISFAFNFHGSIELVLQLLLVLKKSAGILAIYSGSIINMETKTLSAPKSNWQAFGIVFMVCSRSSNQCKQWLMPNVAANFCHMDICLGN